MLRLSTAAVYVLLTVTLPLSAWADTVTLRNGERLEGTIDADSFTIATPERGELVIPISSITEVHFHDGGDVSVLLVDGTELGGRLTGKTIALGQGLFSSALGLADIESISIAPRVEPVVLPKSTSIKLMLSEWLHSKSVHTGQTILLCVAEDVHVGNTLAVPKGTPAFGEVTAGHAAARGSQRGEVVIEPRTVLAPDGRRIPVVGAAGEFEGGLNAGAFVVAGVLGFLEKGEEVKVPPGTVLQVITQSDQTLGPPAEPSPNDLEAREECRRFFELSELEEVPVEKVDLQKTYAPFGTAFTASLPLTELADLDKGESLDRTLRNLLAYDTFIQTVTVSVDRGRKAVKLPVWLFVVVLPSHDKRVDVEVALLDGDEVLSEEAQSNLDAEEEKSRQVQMTLSAEPEQFDRALAAGTLRLRISMRVRE